MTEYKIVSAIGAIRLLRTDESYRLISVGEKLKEGDLVELLSPICSISIKSDSGTKSYSGVIKLKVQDGKLLDVTAQSLTNRPKEIVVEGDKTFELVEDVEFDLYSFLRTKLDVFEIEHIVDHKVLFFDISKNMQFFIHKEQLNPDKGCLVVDIDDKFTIKKFDKSVSFTISVHVFHESKVSKYTSYPKSYKFIKVDDDGLIVIRQDKSVKFDIKL